MATDCVRGAFRSSEGTKFGDGKTDAFGQVSQYSSHSLMKENSAQVVNLVFTLLLLAV